VKKPIRPNRLLPLALQRSFDEQEQAYAAEAARGSQGESGGLEVTEEDIARARAMQPQRPRFATLDPLVTAAERRKRLDPLQHGWELSRDAALMLEAIKATDGTAAATIAPAKWMLGIKNELAAHVGGFGNMQKLTVEHTLLSAAKLLHKGHLESAVAFLAPVKRLLFDKSPDAIAIMLCSVIRRVYPNAPKAWTVAVTPPPPLQPPTTETPP
jgi:hypothetical protein